MNRERSTLKFAALSILASILSVLVGFLGAPILRVLRSVYGAKYFWLTGAILFSCLAGFGVYSMAFLLMGTWLTVGLYSEAEAKGHAGFAAGLISVLIGTVFVIYGPKLLPGKNIDFIAEVGSTIESIMSQVQSTNNTQESSSMSLFKVEPKTIIAQIPSILFLILLMSLSMALMLDRKTALMFNVKYERIASQIRLLEFRVPDHMIWLMMVSFLLTFVKVGNEAVTVVAMNVFNIMMGFYFLQGLAILEVLMLVFRAGPFIRMLVYFIIVGQLFFILSAVGVIDYWIDFRRRIRNLRARGSHNNGEQI
ncbi:MAG: hypothetical protein BroJett040_09650 [Oligoflexia bacterium]|nr:MAG: hypothetical protein BroJett040_09650 [Oligoflexia bacterium]